MRLYKHATAGLCLGISLLAGTAVAATTGQDQKDTGVHTEVRPDVKETPADVKGKGGGILDKGPVKVRKEDQKAGTSEKMYDTQYETDRTKKKEGN